jgi:hypothetical protein
VEAIAGRHSIDSVKRQLYWEHHTEYGKYCSVKLESWAVWGSQLVQEQTQQGEMACGKRQQQQQQQNNKQHHNNVETNLGSGRNASIIVDILTIDITVAT